MQLSLCEMSAPGIFAFDMEDRVGFKKSDLVFSMRMSDRSHLAEGFDWCMGNYFGARRVIMNIKRSFGVVEAAAYSFLLVGY